MDQLFEFHEILANRVVYTFAYVQEPKYIKISIICTLNENIKKNLSFFSGPYVFRSPLFPLFNETMPIAVAFSSR